MSKGTLRQTSSSRDGFTMVELLVSVSVLLTVFAVVLTYVNKLQQVYTSEETKVDSTSNSRTILDGLQRELHQAGFPNAKLFGPGVLITPAASDSRDAVGIVEVSSSDLWFEGDIDNDGQVESVRYTLMDASGAPAVGGGNCPCTLRRSQVVKQDGAPLSQATAYVDALPNIINSGGIGGSGGLTILGNSGAGTNDTLFAAYKAAPVFSAFDQSGNPIALPVDLNSSPSVVAKIRTILININQLSTNADSQVKMRMPLSMTISASISNN